MRPRTSLVMESSFLRSVSVEFLSMKPSSNESCKRVSNSLMDPEEMNRNRLNSFLVCRAAPSAMLTGTETAARLNWDTKRNFSSIGKCRVMTYTSFTKAKLSFHASKRWCGRIQITDNGTLYNLLLTININNPHPRSHFIPNLPDTIYPSPFTFTLTHFPTPTQQFTIHR